MLELCRWHTYIILIILPVNIISLSLQKIKLHCKVSVFERMTERLFDVICIDLNALWKQHQHTNASEMQPSIPPKNNINIFFSPIRYNKIKHCLSLKLKRVASLVQIVV